MESVFIYLYTFKILNTKEITKRIRKIKNKILAIDAAPAAIPVNPKIAATIATIKNNNAKRAII